MEIQGLYNGILNFHYIYIEGGRTLFLKKLIVEGFKSIGIRKEIDFLNAINIIMGVNGSGKSNVFECIEWVLGGKSAKQLRASNMEDVIFDGGQSSGRANFAEATLVFDNTNREIGRASCRERV